MQVTICGLKEIGIALDLNVSHIISFSDPDTSLPFGLSQAVPAEHHHCFKFHDIIMPIDGYVAPRLEDIERVISIGRTIAEDHLDRLLVHCHLGISRSTAAALVILAQRFPGEARKIEQRVGALRSICWPNSLMLKFADEILGSGQAIAQMGSNLRRDTAIRNPGFAEAMKSTHRASEVVELALLP